jgi:hypothetical protein
MHAYLRGNLMSEDRGLSIFDEEQSDEDAPTQVMPRVQDQAAPAAAQARPAARPPAEKSVPKQAAPASPT